MKQTIKSFDSSGFCAIASIVNFMYPQWHPIPCDTSIETTVVCAGLFLYPKMYKQPLQTAENVSTHAAQTFCEAGKLLFENE